MLFLVYFNDLPDTLESAVDSYADDITIAASGTSLEEIEAQLTSDCEKIDLWMKSNRLKLNPSKTHILMVGTQRKIASMSRKIEVKMDNVQLQESSSGSELLLGCKVEANLKWKQHVSFLISKLGKRLKGLNHLQYICPLEVRKMIASGIFTSVLVYCLPLYGGMEKNLIKEIQVMQNRAARLVYRAPLRFNRSLLLGKLDWLSVNQLIWYHSLLTVYRIRTSRVPEYLSSIMCRLSRNGRIVIPHSTLTIASNSFCFRATAQWNRLPIGLRIVTSVGIFKRRLKKWVQDHVPQFVD